MNVAKVPPRPTLTAAARFRRGSAFVLGLLLVLSLERSPAAPGKPAKWRPKVRPAAGAPGLRGGLTASAPVRHEVASSPAALGRSRPQYASTVPVVEVNSEIKSHSEPEAPRPVPFSLREGLPTTGPTIELEAPDLTSVLEEDAAGTRDEKGLRRIGLRRVLPAPVRVHGRESSAGVWRDLADGGRLWTLSIQSAQAEAMRVHFEDVALPAGAALLVYDPEQPQEACGPYDRAFLGERRGFWSESVFAAKVTIELYLPPAAGADAPAFTVREVTHRYVKLLAADAQPAQVGNCEIDVTCRPEWLATARAIARVTFISPSGEDQCTGCLIADADPNTTIDYFYTANHCLANQATAEDAEFHWLYQTASCNGAPPNIASVPRTVGADFLAGLIAGPGDAALVRLRQAPPAGVTYVGWSTAPPGLDEELAIIHHPKGAHKHISFGKVSSWWANFYQVRWHSGSTERASSGGPLFNSAQKLIGQLRGGTADCERPEGIDNLGRFDVAFPVLQDWLLNRPVLVPNDNFVNAQLLPDLAGTLTANCSGAGKEAGEPDHAGNAGGRSLWYRWVAPADGRFTFDTVGSSIDTLLAVYTGASLGDLAVVASNDDFGPWSASRISFTAVARTGYYVAVDAFKGGAGRVVLNWQPGALSNDDFNNAREISGPTGEANASNIGMTKEPNERDHAGDPGGQSIWFRWIAPANGSVTFDTEGSVSIDPDTGQYLVLDTVLAVYTGSTVGSLTSLADNDDIDVASEIYESRVSFTAVAGTEYRIAVDGVQLEDGSVENGFVVLTWRQEQGAGTSAPPNNNFANGKVISGGTGSVSGTTVKATKEASEPAHNDTAGGRSIWFRWTAPGNGLVTFDTAGSSFDSVLAVYRGNSLGTLAYVLSNDDIDNFTRQSRLTFAAAAGTEYRVAVDGYLTTGNTTREGDVVLNWNLGVGTGGNDAFANAQTISGGSGRVNGTNVAATKEAGEPVHAGDLGGASIWFRWTAPADGPVTFDTVGSTFDTALAVYVGASVASLTPMMSDEDIDQDAGVYQSRLTFDATAGREYRIAVEGFLSPDLPVEEGSVVLNWAQTPVVRIVFSEPRVLADGSFRCTIAGPAGSALDVEVSANLTAWTKLTTRPNPTGTVDFSDAPPAGAARRFYRARPGQ
ncbi:MAG: trypsin-like peptidase domain-containing protein [Verrucomicrobia bacterium]|nr:trypsin-like peptidase domain-containing protein [Verrucomicrobiota bacterium]